MGLELDVPKLKLDLRELLEAGRSAGRSGRVGGSAAADADRPDATGGMVSVEVLLPLLLLLLEYKEE